MNQRDISEIKRRLNPEKKNPSRILGCYVTHDGKVISTFTQSLHNMPQEENEKYMAIFKKTLSGTLGQNLLPVDFDYQQVQDSEEHRLLTALRASALKDEDAVEALYTRAIAYVQEEYAKQAQSVEAEQNASNYLILLMHDGYDVPVRNNNDELDYEQGTEVFSYILCSICPVKQTKPALSYFAEESEFHNKVADWVVSAPELGFMYPAYEERAANIYRAMYYTRSAADMHEAFVQSVFNTSPMMTAPEQKETIAAILQESLAEECSLDVVAAVRDTVCTMIEETKADKGAEPLALSGSDVKHVLESCGVSEEKQAVFQERFTEAFGETAQIPAVNVVPTKEFKVTTPSVSIRVDPERSDLIETRVIDGKYYILVLADGDVEVNGMKIQG